MSLEFKIYFANLALCFFAIGVGIYRTRKKKRETSMIER